MNAVAETCPAMPALSAGLLASFDPLPILASPLAWALVVGAIGLWLMMPLSSRRVRIVGIVLAGIGLLLFGYDCQVRAPLGDSLSVFVLWSLGAMTVGSAAAAITTRSAIYTAIWFAVSLLGTAGLFLFQGAQFLGVATIVVYAGAIVVTFLFVVMLAQPEGADSYDRLSWGRFATPASVIGSTFLIGVLAMSLASVREAIPPGPPAIPAAELQLAHKPQPAHMAALGNELFSRHLLEVEVAGTLLLVALVGAIAIGIQGRKAADVVQGPNP